jgi:hypothetical protein
MVMLRRLTVIILTVFSLGIATRIWTPEELKTSLLFYQPSSCYRPDTVILGPRRFNYLQRIKLLCDFLVRYQVSDSTSPDYGGIIEAEHLPNIIETDNTQEALWVWTRWYELTLRDDYQQNISRAWHYILNHPAYQEHQGNPANIWYAVWNCGLGMWAEALYRRVYNDSTYLFYGDSCRDFYLTHPLNPANYLENFVTAQSSGMAYDYARERNDPVLKDSALVRGMRVKNWIEENARNRLGFQNWAMCGGTAFWGVAKTFCQDDTVAGKRWLLTYAESLPGFYPTGTWNCSHNIWLANAYRAAAELTSNPAYFIYHQYLTDTLLMKDTDLDGGIPATWTDPNTQDQTWVSTYLDFMGMDRLVSPVYDNDLSVLQFVQPAIGRLYLIGDTVDVRVPVANVGRNNAPLTTLTLFVDSVPIDSTTVPSLPFLATDTFAFSPLHLNTSGPLELRAVLRPDQNTKNDTTAQLLKVYKHCTITGTLIDSLNSSPVMAKIKAQLFGRSAIWDSTSTDSLGNFSLSLIDSVFVLTVEPPPPYHHFSRNIRFNRDTTITLNAQPAAVLIVNNDSLRNYTAFYTTTLDTLGVSYCIWLRDSAGPLPGSLLDRLQNRTVIWFTGNTRYQTVPAEDQDTLTQFVLRGGNLLLTGQNIAEELARTQFLETIAGCRFDSSGYSGFLVFGNRADSVGRAVIGTATAGGNGANNQTSRDIIAPTGNSRLFLLYDTTTNLGAGVRNQLPSGGRIITLGFGFEAVNKPASRPNYFTRVQLMNTMLQWLIYGTGISETSPIETTNKPPVTITPTVFQNHLLIVCDQSLPITIFDLSGRQVFSTRIPAGKTRLRLSGLKTGIYFLRAGTDSPSRLIKIK